MDYNLKALYAEIIDEYRASFESLRDTEDFIPNGVVKLIDKKLESAMRASFRQAFWENWKIRRRERKERRLAAKAAKDNK